MEDSLSIRPCLRAFLASRGFILMTTSVQYRHSLGLLKPLRWRNPDLTSLMEGRGRLVHSADF